MRMIKTKRTLIAAGCVTAIFTISCTNTKKQQTEETSAEVKVEQQQEQETNLDFNKTLTWDNTSYEITVTNNSLTVQPNGLEVVNNKFTHDILGKSVVNAEIEDLNGDGYAEVLVYLASDGSGSYGEVIAYSSNNGKSLSQVTYNLEGDSDEIKAGYMGHDKYSIIDNVLTREFPIYKDGDINANPTGGTKIVKYKLVDGEASRKFIVDNVEVKE